MYKMQEVGDQNLFTLLERGDRLISKIKDKVIMLLGLTKAGSICTYNWILGKQMISNNEEIKTKYINVNCQDQSAAIICDQYASATLAPNMADVDSSTTLIDMAGYGCNRHYVGAIIVPWFLKSVFQLANNIKFLLVINEQTFFNPTGIQMIKTFQQFLKMFQHELLTPESYQKLFFSISLVITQATKSRQQYVAYIKKIISKINHPLFKVERKTLIIKMIESIMKSQRIQCFQLAKCNQLYKQCQILQKLNQSNWQYMRKEQIEQPGRSNHQFTFAKIFLKSTQIIKQLCYNVISKRISGFIQFSQIIGEFIFTLKSNWISTAENASLTQLPNNFMDRIFCLENIFQSIKDFINQNDLYDSNKFFVDQREDINQEHSSNKSIGNQKKRIQYGHPRLTQSICRVLNIYSVVNLMDDQGNFQQRIRRLSQFIKEITKQLEHFCANGQEYWRVRRLEFIL